MASDPWEEIYSFLCTAPQRLETYLQPSCVCLCAGVFFIVSPDKTSAEGGLRASGGRADNGGRESDYPCSLACPWVCVRGLINVLIPTYFKCTFSGRNMPFPRPPDPHYPPLLNGKRCADWKLWPLLTPKLYNEQRLGFIPAWNWAREFAAGEKRGVCVSPSARWGRLNWGRRLFKART